ncbi:MAG: NADPH:quinone oxidoreductase family protein [Minwuia sp.]|uniref:NADPH:quinone oxidoreductase family protein n=1 Tax=Minwuia sp. TaxID=2493630 RepID=UPI003A8427E3
MKAMMVDELGPPEIMQFKEMPDPVAGPGEIRVRIRAVGLNFPDILMIAGKYQHKPDLPFAPGMEAAGEVLDVGDGVTDYAPGQRVIIHGKGGMYAEQAVVPEAWAVPLPESWSFEEGAAFWSAYLTAYVGLVSRGRMQAGETALIHGAAGGVGLAAVELAHALGARVIAVAGGKAKCDAVLAKGADFAIDHRTESFRDRVMEITDGAGADVIYDPVGGDVVFQSLRSIAWGGRLLIIGFAGGTIPEVPANYALLKSCKVIGVRAGEYGRRDPAAGRQVMRHMLELADSGKLQPHVHAVMPLQRAVDALAEISSRRVVGKMVLAC